jgi:hypothetical protein
MFLDLQRKKIVCNGYYTICLESVHTIKGQNDAILQGNVDLVVLRREMQFSFMNERSGTFVWYHMANQDRCIIPQFGISASCKIVVI